MNLILLQLVLKVGIPVLFGKMVEIRTTYDLKIIMMLLGPGCIAVFVCELLDSFLFDFIYFFPLLVYVCGFCCLTYLCNSTPSVHSCSLWICSFTANCVV